MLVAVSWPSQSAPKGNLVVNGSFEHGLAPWGTLGGGSLERTTRQARFGAASGAVTARTDERAGIYWYGAVVRPRRGDRYTLTVWVRAAPTADNDRIVMELIEHAGGFEDRHVADAQLYLDPKWKRMRASGTVARSGRLALDIAVFVPKPDRRGETFYLDGITLTRSEARSPGAA